MGILISLLVTSLVSPAAWSTPEKTDESPVETAIKEASQKLCHSTAEYEKALKFLRTTKDFTFPEKIARKIADDVSKGCDGAAERFSMVILLLKNIGLSEHRSLQLALEFAAQSPDVQKNFVEIFTNAFLAEFFDFDYSRALKLGIELSKDYKGDPKIVRDDFLRLVRFCKESDRLDLPMSLCADYMAKIAHSSQFYQKGVSQPFLDFFGKLRESKEYQLDVKNSLKVAEQVLKDGPTASENFTQAFDFARKELGLDKRQGLEFAIHLASRSFVGSTPPVMQFPKLHEEKK